MNKMRKILSVLIAAALVLSSVPFAFAQSAQSVEKIVSEDYESYLNSGGDNEAQAKEGTDYVSGEVLFTLVSSQTSASAKLNSIKKDFGLEILEVIDQSALKQGASAFSADSDNETLYRASFDAEKMTVFELCKAMNEQSDVKDCEPNYIYAQDSFVMPTEISSSSQYKSYQKWYFDYMQIPETWEKYSNLGEGTVVCVIDCGLNYTHNDIKDNLWDDGNGNHGYNAEFNNNDIYGQEAGGPAHGTHCAGIIAMQGGNGGLVGVAPKSKIMVCNAATAATGTFTNANLIKSLEYAVSNGADIISMSLGGYFFSVNMEKALARASFSAVVLCAAGNDGLNAATRLHYPSASSAVIGVMALGSGSYSKTLSSYSNYDLTGRYYQLAAPGTNIYALGVANNTGYVSMTGTSMATPFMAGIAALYASEHPDMSPTEMRNSIINAAGDMVKGYKSDAQSYSFKRATAYTMLEQKCAAAEYVNFTNSDIESAVRDSLNVSSSYRITNYDLECVTVLDLSGTDFRDYSSLSQLKSLTTINLSNTAMTDADAENLIEYLPDTVLNFELGGNELTNLDFFQNYGGYISRLVVANNKITDISGISGYTMLSDLDISSNAIKDISPVSTLSGLVYLYAPGNIIEDVSPIINMPMLEEVYFGNYNPNFTDMFGELYFLSGAKGNHISSLEPFMNLNTSKAKLHYLNLSYNYVNKDSEYNYRVSKLMQLMDTIAQRNNFESIFLESVAYKLIVSPFAQGKLIFAEDISFENGRNFTTLYTKGEGFSIPYTIVPENANAKNSVRFTVKDSSVLYVDSEGKIYPKAEGSTYVTLTLENGKARTYFVNVKDSFVVSASILNPCSSYTAGESYNAVIYTAPCSAVKLSDQNGNTVAQFDSSGKYAYNLTDKNGNNFIKWIVPFSISAAGEYTITASAYSDLSGGFTQKAGSFEMLVNEKFGNTVYGEISSYNTRFDTTVSIFAEDSILIQTLTLSGSALNSGEYSFTNIANGKYTIKIEKDGYKPYYIEDVIVDGDTQVTEGSTSSTFTDFAGDFNADESIDIGDISLLLLEGNYAKDTDTAENIVCDINADNIVNISDLAVVLSNLDR